jgi:hypothetical protein
MHGLDRTPPDVSTHTQHDESYRTAKQYLEPGREAPWVCSFFCVPQLTKLITVIIIKEKFLQSQVQYHRAGIGE